MGIVTIKDASKKVLSYGMFGYDNVGITIPVFPSKEHWSMHINHFDLVFLLLSLPLCSG